MNTTLKPVLGQCIRRDAILEAATEIFSRDGIQGASIDLIASKAGVSRQTIYNHYRDKDMLLAAVIENALDRVNANIFAVMATFPNPKLPNSKLSDHNETLLLDLTHFAIQLCQGCLNDCHGEFLRRLLQTGQFSQFDETHPSYLTEIWRTNGPGRMISILGAHLARLSLSGHLSIDDPDLAARHFLALINADMHFSALTNDQANAQRLKQGAFNGVRTFLRAFGTRPENAVMRMPDFASFSDFHNMTSDI